MCTSRLPLLLVGYLMGATALACAPEDFTQKSPQEPIAFMNAHLIPMQTAETLQDQTVLIRDGKVVSVGPTGSVDVPVDTAVIDAHGCYLMPGLTEMHAHIPSPAQGPDMLKRVLRLFLVNGVTSVRGMLGHEAHLTLRQALAEHAELGPRLITSGPSLNGTSVQSPEHAMKMVSQQKAAGFDFIKLHPGLSWEEYQAVAAKAGELQIPFAGHVSIHVGLARTLSAGQATIDHLDGYMQALTPDAKELPPSANNLFGLPLGMLADEDRIELVAQQTAKAGVWNVPTQTVAENFVSPEDPGVLAARPEMQYMPRRTIDGWRQSKHSIQSSEDYAARTARRYIEIRRRLIKALHEQGAGLLLGSDAPQVFNVPGFSTLRELDVLVQVGLTPYEALQTGTVNAGMFFGLPGSLGTVKQGSEADLVLLAGNPLENLEYLARPAGVMSRGRWLSRETIDGILRELRE